MLIKQEYITISELIKQGYTNLNISRLNKLCKKLINQFPNSNLIIGGGQGKKYMIHSSIIDQFTRKRFGKNSNKIIEDHIKVNVGTKMFFSTKWKYYVTFNPKEYILPNTFTNRFPKDYFRSLFYGIHTHPFKVEDKNHIHLVIDSDMTMMEIKNIIVKHFKINSQAISISVFDEKKILELFPYLRDREKLVSNISNQRSINYEFIRGAFNTPTPPIYQ